MDRVPVAAPGIAQNGAKRARQRNKVAYALGPRGLNLPSALNLTEELVERVCGELEGFLAAGRC